MDFETYHTISNVNSSNNKFYFDKDDKEIVIPERSIRNTWHKQVSKNMQFYNFSNIAKEKTLRKEDEEPIDYSCQ